MCRECIILHQSPRAAFSQRLTENWQVGTLQGACPTLSQRSPVGKAMLAHRSNFLDNAGFIGFLPSLPYFFVPTLEFPGITSQLTTESLLPSLLLGEAEPRQCPAPLGLQELLCNSQRLYPKGVGTSHTGQVPSLSPPRLTLTT